MKKNLLCLAFICLSSFSWANNNNCNNAYNFSITTVSSDTLSISKNEVWIKYSTPEEHIGFTFTLASTGFTVSNITLYSGNCGNLQVINSFNNPVFTNAETFIEIQDAPINQDLFFKITSTYISEGINNKKTAQELGFRAMLPEVMECNPAHCNLLRNGDFQIYWEDYDLYDESYSLYGGTNEISRGVSCSWERAMGQPDLHGEGTVPNAFASLYSEFFPSEFSPASYYVSDGILQRGIDFEYGQNYYYSYNYKGSADLKLYIDDASSVYPKGGNNTAWVDPLIENMNAVLISSVSVGNNNWNTKNGCFKAISGSGAAVDFDRIYFITKSNKTRVDIDEVYITPFFNKIESEYKIECGGSVTFGDCASKSNPVNYSWSPASGLSCVNCATPIASPIVTTVYTVTASYGDCSETKTVTVEVSPIIPLEIIANSEYSCVQGENFAVASLTNGYSYSWTVQNGSFTQNTDGSINVYWNTAKNYSDGGFVSVTATSANGCTITDKVFIKPCCQKPVEETPKETIYLNPGDYLYSKFTGTSSSADVVVNGTVYIDQKITFNNSTFTFGPWAKIEFLTNDDPSKPSNVKFNTCTLKAGCNKMWDGIYLSGIEQSVNFTRSVVQDAENAVNSEAGARVDIIKSIFNKNLRYVSLKNFTGNYNGLIHSSKFTCEVSNISPQQNLLYPHSSLQSGYLGIILDNFKTNIKIGRYPNNYTFSPNYFKNLGVGILSISSNMEIYNNDFLEMSGSLPSGYPTPVGATGYGILSYNKTSNPSILKVGGSLTNQNNIFNNMSQAIRTDGRHQVQILNNIINKMWQFGIQVRDNKYADGSVVINQNVISNFQHGGILINNNAGCSNINVFGNKLNTLTPLSYITSSKGIIVNEVFAESKCAIDNNEINRTIIGIDVLNFKNISITANTIKNFVDIGSNTALNAVGIKVSNAPLASVIENKIFGISKWNLRYSGISLNSSENSYVKCNVIQNIQTGMIFIQQSLNSQVQKNEMTSCRNGIYLFANGEIGPQTSPDEASDNQWINPNDFQYYTFSNNSPFGFKCILYLRNDPSGAFYHSDFDQKSEFTESATPIPNIIIDNSLTASKSCDSKALKSGKFAYLNEILMNEEEDAFSKWHRKNALHGLVNDSIIDKDSIDASIEVLETSNSREILDLKKALSRPKEEIIVEETELNAKIESINPENIYEENYKAVFKEHLKKTLDNSYTFESSIQEINDNCLENTGRALFHAIGLKNAFEEIPELFPTLCSQPDFNANKMTGINNILQSKEIDLQPNPAKDEININSSENGFLIIYSLEGKKLKQMEIEAGKNLIQLDLTNGLYIIEIQSKNGSSKTRLSIIN